MLKNLRFRRAAFLAAILPVLATGCESIFGSSEIERERDELEEARALWESRGHDSYEMVVSHVCYCGPMQVRVRVQGGVVVSRVDVNTGQPVPAGPMYDGVDTVEDLFLYIERELDDDPHHADADYDPELGFPTNAYFDREENVVDEEGGFVVTEFTLLPVAV